MSVFVAMGAMAALFIIFGLLRPKGECSTEGGCAGCGAVCHRRPDNPEEVP